MMPVLYAKHLGAQHRISASCISLWFSRPVVSNSLQPHGLQHARPPCPSPLLEFTQTHVHWVGDAIQPSHLLSPSSPALNLSQHQGLFQWVGLSHQVAKVLKLQLQRQLIGTHQSLKTQNERVLRYFLMYEIVKLEELGAGYIETWIVLSDIRAI